MSVICQNFVQNAWRKDLCSNCFKSEADHSSPGYKNTVDRGRYVPQATSVYQARVISPGIHWRPLLPDSVSRIHDPVIYDKLSCRDFGSQTNVIEKIATQNGMKTMSSSNNKGILKQKQNPKTKGKPRRTSVGFVPEEPLVIGYGGNDYDSDEGTWELGSDDGSINLELLDCTDEDRSITKLTKNNTEFNSVNDNLIPNPNIHEDNDQTIKTRSYHYSTPNLPLNQQNTHNKTNILSTEDSDERHDKKLSFYYFATKNEPPKIQNRLEQVNYLDECKEMSIIAKDIPGILNNVQNNYNDESKVENLNKINNFSRTHENIKNKCHLQSSSKYLLITKMNDNGEASSDSDYSTSKQTNGESSTDTDSFHDAEETIIPPCSSFLHGTSHQDIISHKESSRNYMNEKPFETSSISSGDTSTLSDDSDSHNINIRKNIKSKVHQNKSNKLLPNATNSSNEDYSIIAKNKPKLNVSISHHSEFPNTNNLEVETYFNTNLVQNNSNNRLFNESNTNYDDKNPSPQTDATIIETQKATSIIIEHKKNNVEKSNSRFSKENNHNEINKTVNVSNVENDNKSQWHTNKQTDEKYEKNENIIQQSHNRLQSLNVASTPKETPKPANFVTPKTSITNVYNASPNENLKQTPNKQQQNIKVRTSPNMGLIESKSCDDRQRMLTECKNIISSNKEWKSADQLNQPAISEINGQDLVKDQCHLEKDQSESSSQSSARSSPNSKLNRQTKLAALALELEKVRCDSKNKLTKSSSVPLTQSEPPKHTNMKERPAPKPEKLNQSLDDFQTLTPANTSGKYPSIKKEKSLLSSTSISKLASLPDLLPETTTTKIKKGRFSLKKLLKRGKDSETLVISGPVEHSQKAWKRQTFDRSRLSLEIVHPMDLTGESQTSNDSTPTEDKNSRIYLDPSGKKSKVSRHNSGTLRARSLSALPQLTSCVFDTSDAVIANGLQREMTNSDTATSLDRTRLDMPRKAGTVAERGKKYKAPRRTPSFSELRTSTPSSGQTTNDENAVERPPKPPPPPRGKSLPPPLPSTAPPPPSTSTLNKMSEKSPAPARPPPPKGLTGKENGTPGYCTFTSRNIHEQLDGDYANLGDIRLHITPKKPGRPSAISFARDSLEMDTQDLTPRNSMTELNPLPEEDNTYESVENPAEEEDHYTYLDDTEGKAEKQKNYNLEHKSKNPTPKTVNLTNDGDKSQNNDNYKTCAVRETSSLKKPWLDLQASYSAIAAANYESLAEFITTAINEGLEKFQKTASSLKWNDFSLESEEPLQILEDKCVYNAIYKIQPDINVTLMLTQRQHTGQSCRNSIKPPILASFNDCIPQKYIDICNKAINETKLMIYVLERSKATTVEQFADNSTSYNNNQHIHLRNSCFVLLQLIHTLKSLQADGIEEIDYDLRRLLLLYTDADKPPILVLLPGDKAYLTMSDFYKADVATRKTTLCQTTLQLLLHLLRIKDVKELTDCVVHGEFLAAPVVHTFRVISKVLSEEKASSLTQAKGLLEYMLWGPVDIKTSENENDVDIILQRWLDLQRAQMVKSLISNLHLKLNSHTGFHVYEEYQLIFLLQATVKSLKDIIMKL